MYATALVVASTCAGCWGYLDAVGDAALFDVSTVCQATVSWGEHLYDGSCTHVFDCHRLGQCGSNVHIFARLLV